MPAFVRQSVRVFRGPFSPPRRDSRSNSRHLVTFCKDDSLSILSWSLNILGGARLWRHYRIWLTLSETTLTGKSWFHISPPRGFEPGSLVMGSKQVNPLDLWDMVRIMWDCRLSTGLPPSSRLCRLWNQKGDLQRAWNRDRKAVWDQVGLSHCRHESLVMVWDKACLRRGHDDQSRRGHQCSETTLTGESRFHISPPRGFEPGSLVMGS